MIKRDLTAWDFIENKPKTELVFVEGATLTFTDGTWATTTIPEFHVENTVLLGFNGEGLRVDANNQVTISDLVVAGSADIPPSQGQLRYNVENGTTEAYVDGEWIELGPATHYPLPRESKWGKFKNLFKNLLA